MSKRSSVAKYQRLNRPAYGHGKKRNKYRLWQILCLLLLLALSIAGYYAYRIYNSPIGRNEDTVYLLIGRKTTIEELEKQVQTKVWPRYPRLMRWLMDQKGVASNLHPGRYAVTPQMTMSDLVETLANGTQTPVVLKIRQIRTEADLIKMLDNHLMIDSTEIRQALHDPKRLNRLGITQEQVRSLFLVGDYSLLWNIEPSALMSTIEAHHNRFWTAKRRAQAQTLGLTPAEVTALAAIIEEESSKEDEYSRIAGLYLNRLRKNIKLQSDPTVKYALGNFELRRILRTHLAVESAYNTYYVTGLTPGPIRLPRPASIDYVLNAEEHDYLYMCAKEDFSGRHNFASGYAQHLVNAKRYQAALDARGIK